MECALLADQADPWHLEGLLTAFDPLWASCALDAECKAQLRATSQRLRHAVDQRISSLWVRPGQLHELHHRLAAWSGVSALDIEVDSVAQLTAWLQGHAAAAVGSDNAAAVAMQRLTVRSGPTSANTSQRVKELLAALPAAWPALRSLRLEGVPCDTGVDFPEPSDLRPLADLRSLVSLQIIAHWGTLHIGAGCERLTSLELDAQCIFMNAACLPALRSLKITHGDAGMLLPFTWHEFTWTALTSLTSLRAEQLCVSGDSWPVPLLSLRELTVQAVWDNSNPDMADLHETAAPIPTSGRWGPQLPALTSFSSAAPCDALSLLRLLTAGGAGSFPPRGDRRVSMPALRLNIPNLAASSLNAITAVCAAVRLTDDGSVVPAATLHLDAASASETDFLDDDDLPPWMSLARVLPVLAPLEGVQRVGHLRVASFTHTPSDLALAVATYPALLSVALVDCHLTRGCLGALHEARTLSSLHLRACFGAGLGPAWLRAYAANAPRPVCIRVLLDESHWEDAEDTEAALADLASLLANTGAPGQLDVKWLD